MRSDSSIWLSAMHRELESLEKRQAFERTFLPPVMASVDKQSTTANSLNSRSRLKTAGLCQEKIKGWF